MLGVIYSPQPIVHFMIASVDHVLAKRFQTLPAEEGVHIFDPLTGTGDFIVNLLQRISDFALKEKDASELPCNEVRLLPYYVASF